MVYPACHRQREKTVSGAKVTVRQKSHEFKIGANLFALHEMESDEQNREYERLFADRIPSWEVTNELLYIPGAGHFAHFYQPDMLEWDFRMADRLFPTNRLLINKKGNKIIQIGI